MHWGNVTAQQAAARAGGKTMILENLAAHAVDNRSLETCMPLACFATLKSDIAHLVQRTGLPADCLSGTY